MFSLCAIKVHALPLQSYQDIFEMYEHVSTIQRGIHLITEMTGKCYNRDLLYDINLFKDYFNEYLKACTDFTFTKQKRRQVSDNVIRTFYKNDISTIDIQSIITKSVNTLDRLVGF